MEESVHDIYICTDPMVVNGEKFCFVCTENCPHRMTVNEQELLVLVAPATEISH